MGIVERAKEVFRKKVEEESEYTKYKHPTASYILTGTKSKNGERFKERHEKEKAVGAARREKAKEIAVKVGSKAATAGAKLGKAAYSAVEQEMKAAKTSRGRPGVQRERPSLFGDMSSVSTFGDTGSYPKVSVGGLDEFRNIQVFGSTKAKPKRRTKRKSKKRRK